MERSIANLIKEKRGSLYKQGAEMFDTTYFYVAQIASEPKRGTRGKGKLIKEWLLQQLNKENN